MIRSLISFWVNHVHTKIVSLVATIGVFGLITSSVTIFILAKLVNEVIKKEAFSFDESILLSIHSVANPNLDRVMLTITELGNPPIVLTVFATSIIVLWRRRYYQELIMLAIASFGAFIFNTELKLLFIKVRPQLWTQLIQETSFSFPSGHALGSIVLYGFIAYLLAKHYPQLSTSIYTLATILIAAIGLSRLYLGVHWPTDIIAGYGVGFLWLTSCITMLRLGQMNRSAFITLEKKNE